MGLETLLHSPALKTCPAITRVASRRCALPWTREVSPHCSRKLNPRIPDINISYTLYSILLVAGQSYLRIDPIVSAPYCTVALLYSEVKVNVTSRQVRKLRSPPCLFRQCYDYSWHDGFLSFCEYCGAVIINDDGFVGSVRSSYHKA